MARPTSKTTDNTTRVVGYCRVSTDQQAEHGASLDAQVEKIRQYAALYGLELVAVIEDRGASAKTLDREGLQTALAMLRKGHGEGLLICKLDRLTRSVKDLGTLIEQYFDRYTLMSIEDKVDTGSASGRLILNVLMSVSQWEREAIGERTKAVMAHKRAMGERTSRFAPYGFQIGDDGKTLVPDRDEQALLDAIREAHQRGLTQRALVAELTRQGFCTRKGTALSRMQVQRIMRQANIA